MFIISFNMYLKCFETKRFFFIRKKKCGRIFICSLLYIHFCDIKLMVSSMIYFNGFDLECLTKLLLNLKYNYSFKFIVTYY